MTDQHLALERAIVDAINAALGAKQINTSELARRMDRPYDSTRNYLTFERRLPLDFLLAVAETLGTTADALVVKARTEYLEERLKTDA